MGRVWVMMQKPEKPVLCQNSRRYLAAKRVLESGCYAATVDVPRSRHNSQSTHTHRETRGRPGEDVVIRMFLRGGGVQRYLIEGASGRGWPRRKRATGCGGDLPMVTQVGRDGGWAALSLAIGGGATADEDLCSSWARFDASRRAVLGRAWLPKLKSPFGSRPRGSRPGESMECYWGLVRGARRARLSGGVTPHSWRNSVGLMWVEVCRRLALARWGFE